MDLGSAGRGPKTKKPSVPKAWRDLRKSSKKALKLFSSFLRGASCPKSPRFKRKGVNSSPSQLHLLSDRLASMSSETSLSSQLSRPRPRDGSRLFCVTAKTKRPAPASNTHQQCGSIILGVLFPDEARGNNRNLRNTRPFVQY